jgi:hypothetical protein
VAVPIREPDEPGSGQSGLLHSLDAAATDRDRTALADRPKGNWAVALLVRPDRAEVL